MEAENVTFLKRLGLCVAPIVAAAAIGIGSGESEGPLYVGFRPSKLEQEHSYRFGPLHLQWGRIQRTEKEGHLTYGGR